jgi:DNA-binding CsgD family transcriptional regulator
MPTKLSPREIDVLALIACGMNTPKIAEQLTLSEWTVYSHVRRIRFKLNAQTVAQAVAIAIFDELLPRELVMPE